MKVLKSLRLDAAAAAASNSAQVLATLLLTMCLHLSLGQTLQAQPRRYSLLAATLAPNVGGQSAFSLLTRAPDWELEGFYNSYLSVGGLGLGGVIMSVRERACLTQSCALVETSVSLGGGLATSGPIVQLRWSLVFLSTIRLDVATQAFFSRTRMVLWSYPVWVGVSMPFDLPFIF